MMADKPEVHIENNPSLGLGGLWFIGWLFTWGITHDGLLGGFVLLFFWPYTLGAHFG